MSVSVRNVGLIFILALVSRALVAQTPAHQATRHLPAIDIKTLEGKLFNTSAFENKGKPIIISFWATWCKPCVNELVNISEVYPDWQKETGVKLIAVSIDDARNSFKVQSFANGKNWDYEVYLDPNKEFSNSLSVNNIPHTFLLDAHKNIVWQHNSYTEGEEKHLYELVKKLVAGESIHETAPKN